ncbi:MAG TPA: tetratricopeptide repeat protein [Flavitalea sp.]|nr:tetratricopeptide repeat protein [Flavitalea sp.]
MRIFISIFCCVIFLITQNSVAQDFFDRDSLWRVFEKSKADTNRVHLYIQLGQQYETNNPDSALLLYGQALKLSQQLSYIRGIISYYTNATYVYNVLGRYDTSLVLNLRSVEIARAFGDPERIGACLGNTAASYMTLKRYEKSIEYFIQTTDIYEKLGDRNKLSTLYSNLSVVYNNTGQYEKAREYGERALALARQENNIFAITGSLINLSVVYTSIGHLDKSIALLEEARVLAKKSKNDYSILAIALNLNDAYNRAGKFDTTKAFSEEALSLAKKLDDRESLAMALRGLGMHYFNIGVADKAEEFARQSLEQARKYDLTEDIGKAYSLLAEISILKKEFKQNILYSFKSDSVRNVLFNESIAKNMQELEIKYQSEKKEQQINDLQQESEIKDLSIKQNRLLISILIGSLLAVLIITYLARRTYKQKNALDQSRIAELEKEKQLTASEAVIKGQDEERGRLAKDLHDGLGGLLSGVKFSLTNMKSNVVLDGESALVFERSLDMLDHSITELRRVAHNMMPEVLLKFGLSEALKSYCDSLRESKIYKVDFQSIGMENRLASNTEIFIYRIIQELLNNISKHAHAAHVLVQLARHDDELNVTVEDNGMGMDKNKIEASAGAGWKNIHSRVEYLKGKLDVQSTQGQGTSVHITIPIA